MRGWMQRAAAERAGDRDHALVRLITVLLVQALGVFWRRTQAIASVSWTYTRRAAVAVWRSMRPYGTASWRHPPRGA